MNCPTLAEDLHFVKNSKEGISYIIVYSIDRFSRSGADSISEVAKLKKQGINVLSVTQPTDENTASGNFHQNIHLVFSEYDNQQRRDKCIAGMKEKLLKGEYIGKRPIGYDLVNINGEKRAVINVTGKLLGKAFLWKSEEGLSNTEIVSRLRSMGLEILIQRLTEIFRNPFYCGYIANKLLCGEIVKGKHEPIISEQTFLKVNDLLKDNPQGHIHKKMDKDLPLKKFINCSSCGTTWTGYLVKTKNKFYYKCNRIGCKCNRSAEKLHLLFSQKLDNYFIDSKFIKPLTIQLQLVFDYMNRQNKENFLLLNKKLNEVDEKINKIQERFALGEIEKNIYENINEKFKVEKEAIEGELKKTQIQLSNPEKYIDYSLKLASNLSKLWENADYIMKQNLQYLLFPQGIFYDKEKHTYRTPKVNAVFDLTASLLRDLMENENGQTDNNINLSALVVSTGIEPVSKV